MGENCHHHHTENKKILFTAFLLTAIFAALEVTYGVWSFSLSLLSEGVHMASDGISLLIAALAVMIASTTSNKYKKAEPIAAFINGISLIIVPIIVVYEAINRLVNGSQQILSKEMFIVAVIGLIVNLIVAFILSRGEKDNINVRAAMMHIIADLLSSVSTIVVSLLIMFYDLDFVDAIASIVISIIIFSGGWKITKESIRMLKS
ncbi:cation diffusion facilitator family transporter [Priestia megaterium]|uniref:cation diffusion facilitator family transporter n=1 Tax=Priestia megaterium TaxID=1404 RepID=UPI001493F0E8|nr:cation diffusion facilitator family transporter [Priestia megaterium]